MRTRKINITFEVIDKEFNPSVEWFKSAIDAKLRAEGLGLIESYELISKAKIVVKENYNHQGGE
jgi:hypothetical protein